jgi:type I site-specific restriction-modification system R (restriction) subunit
VNIDYIMLLVAKYHDEHSGNAEIRLSITKAIDSSIELRNKKDLIENFIDSLTPEVTDVDVVWHEYVQRQKEHRVVHWQWPKLHDAIPAAPALLSYLMSCVLFWVIPQI